MESRRWTWAGFHVASQLKKAIGVASDVAATRAARNGAGRIIGTSLLSGSHGAWRLTRLARGDV